MIEIIETRIAFVLNFSNMFSLAKMAVILLVLLSRSCCLSARSNDLSDLNANYSIKIINMSIKRLSTNYITEKQKSQDKKAVFKENTPISAKKSKKVQKSRKIFKKSVA